MLIFVSSTVTILKQRRSLSCRPFRSEFFNVLNHTNFGPPSNVFGSASFGKITTTLPARQIQFGLKLLF